MSRWLSSLLLAVVVQAVPAATIKGTIVDGQLTPIAGASITLEQNSRVVSRTESDAQGRFTLTGVTAGEYVVRATRQGFLALSRQLKVSGASPAVQLPLVMSKPDEKVLQDQLMTVNHSASASVTAAPPVVQTSRSTISSSGGRGGRNAVAESVAAQPYFEQRQAQDYLSSGETYAPIRANRFELTVERKLSTFGADVDTASFTNVRRFLASGQQPPRNAVRVEELVNYFRFNYPAPRDGKPLAITTEIGDCPWAPSHKLLLIGARAATPPRQHYEGRNIVLLIDVSGSMQPAERLPLIKDALLIFVDTLTSSDTIALVTYAGTSGVALPPTSGSEKREIRNAIARLGAGGSTNGASGLIAAYRIAREAFIPGGINRVILATDGDFNVGITSQQDLHRLIERERASGVFLSVLGVGSGNLKDQTMEMLADKGNGNYSYLDSLQEARRVLISEGDATLTTVAKDVKFQVEFNPEYVAEWKLIGYENRKMAARDFENDRKDGGEMGSGHTVTVMYELIPTSEASRRSTGDWFTVNTRYKLPEGETSQLLVHRARPSERREFLPFASAVAEFGLLLRDRPDGAERWGALARRLTSMRVPAGLSEDKPGFDEMVSTARSLARIPRR